LEKEKEYLLGFLKSVNAKLNNERFMSNAKPEIIDIEQRKKADAEAKLQIIQKGLDDLAG
jgi:valyl-tRNA synthetase